MNFCPDVWPKPEPRLESEVAHEARKKALSDASKCFGVAAQRHENDPNTDKKGGAMGRAYREAERILASWAENPERMAGPLRTVAYLEDGGSLL